MKKAVCFLVLVFLLSSAAKADDPEKDNIFIFGAAGVSFQKDFLIVTIPGAYEIMAEFKPGIGLSWGLGFAVLNNFRIETEIHWASNRMGDGWAKVIFPDWNFLGLEGNIRSIRGMLTAWIDTEAINGWAFSFGAGLGMANIHLTKAYKWTQAVVPDPVPIKTLIANGSDWTFCYQLAAAISCQLNPHVRLKLCGRYLGSANSRFADLNSLEYYPDSFSINAGAIGIEIQILKGFWSDAALTKRDLAESYAAVKAAYPIDESNVIIGGFSSGGYGAFDALLDNVLPARAFVVLCPPVPTDVAARLFYRSAQVRMINN